MNEESIFAAALEKPSAAERQAYLDAACGGNPQLRAAVEELLQASDDAGSFLGHAAIGTDATLAATIHSGTAGASGEWTAHLPFLEPLNKPDRLGKLGHYEIIEVVGHGGMGAVLRAFDTKLSRVVAVKVMAPELAANPTAVKRFQREASAAAQVHHDHVVTIHAVEESHRPPYLVMQFIEGQTLQQKIDREGALPLMQILRIGSQMALGLAAAHKLGLIHRDVKPANVLLENGVERVKITDFGLARAADDMEMTQTGMIAGTPQYMSPEQAKGEPIDTRSDLFSLGSVLYTMCTGRPAFRAETTMGVLKRVCDDMPRPVREVNAELPLWLEAIVNKLLAKQPADRFQTATEVAELLGQHLAHLQNPSQVAQPHTVFLAPEPKAIQPKPIQLNRRPPWKLPALLMIIAAVVLSLPLVLAGFIMAGWFFFHSDNRPRSGTVIGQGYSSRTTVPPLALPTPPAVDAFEWGRFLDPVGNCRLERRAGQVEFRLSGTLPYNLIPTSAGGDNAPRLLHEAEGDFVLQVRVLPFEKSKPDTSTAGPQTASWRSAGLLVLGDNQTVVRLERVSWGEKKSGGPMAHCEWFAEGQRRGDFYGSLTDDDRWTILQIERQGNALHLRYSEDGDRWERWQTISDLQLPRRLQVGLVAVHTTPTEFKPVFEDLCFLDAASSGEGADGRPPLAVAKFDAAQAAAHQADWAAHLGVTVEIENSLGMKLRLIPPGEFTMGTDPKALDQLVERLRGDEPLEFVENLKDEKSPRQARLREPFYLGACEVTVGQFRRFVEATGHRTDGEKSGDGGWSGRDGKWVRHPEHIWKKPGAWPLADDQPVVHVSYHDAQAFCAWLSQQEGRRYTLPTEVQWEYAARAGATGLFGATDDPAGLAASAWYKNSLPDDRRNQPQAVGGRAANAFGLFDMLGNVWEMTATWHPVVSDRRIVRGGSWYNQALMARPALRAKGSLPHVALDAGTGFRVAIVGDLRPKAPPPPTEDWTSLFNGRNLTGWKTHPDQPGNWAVEAGALVGRGPPNSSLFSERGDYENFHLRAEVKISEGGDSGISFGHDFAIRDVAPLNPQGFEANICSIQKLNTGSLWVPGKPLAGPGENLVKPNEWFTMELIVRGDQIVIKVNDKTTAEYTNLTYPFRKGHIALQVAAGAPAANMAVHYRKIEIKELPANEAVANDDGFVPLFNGRNLSGWRPGQGVWRVDGNDLIGEKGPGYLFSAKSYENFELRVVARINAEGNSGVSFRRQLQAEMRNDPLCPIGSLLEITPTKTTTLIAYPQIPLKEDEWFTLEIRAQGNSISVRVNDGPWLSARDDRPAGARSAPLQLEAADLNSVVQFRKIEIRELPPETEDRRPSPTDD